MTNLDRFRNETENSFINLADEAGHEIKTNKLVDVAIGALVLGTAIATRGRVANLIADFPRASELLGGSLASAKASDTMRGYASDSVAQELAERTRQEAITKLAMLMTRNSDAAKAARMASEDSGALPKGQTNIAGKGIGLVVFEHATEGARAFLDKTAGNHFTKYLNSLPDSEVSRILEN
jgi:hypothetical protein